MLGLVVGVGVSLGPGCRSGGVGGGAQVAVSWPGFDPLSQESLLTGGFGIHSLLSLLFFGDLSYLRVGVGNNRTFIKNNSNQQANSNMINSTLTIRKTKDTSSIS